VLICPATAFPDGARLVACVAAGQVGTVWATRKENQLPIHITLEDEQRAVNALADFYSSRVQPCLPSTSSCILAARLATKALRRIGIPSEHKHVDATCFNDVYLRHLEAGTSEEDFPASACCGAAWSDLDGTPKSASPWDLESFNGHLIVETEHYIVDLSAPQFDVYEHHIVTGGPLVVPRVDLVDVGGGTWSMPIKLGHYWFSEARLPKYPADCGDWQVGYKPYLADCVKAMRHAMYSEPPTMK